MDEVKEKKSYVPFLRQCFVTLAVSLNILGHGTVLGYSATLIPSLRRPESHIKATLAEESYIASIAGIAQIIGNVLMTLLMGSLGRRSCHFVTVLPIMLGWFLIVMARNATDLILARCLQGISMGMLGPLGSVIIAEMTHPLNRGPFLSTLSLSVTTGVFFTHSIGTYLSWQQSALIMTAIPFCSLLIIIFSPETPPYLISQGRYEDARGVFNWLRGNDESQIGELESLIAAQNASKKSRIVDEKVSFCTKIRRFFRYMSVSFRKREFYKPILIMVFVYIIFQFSGINVLNAYALDIIRQVVGPEANAKLLMVGIDVVRLVCNVMAVYLMKKLNRRTVLCLSGLSCVTCYYIKGCYVYAKTHDMLPAAIQGQWFPVMVLTLYVTLSMGLSVIPFVISGEIFPLEYRALAGGIGNIPLSINTFLAIKCFPILNESIGLPFTYFLYGGIVFGCLVFLYFMLPETKDRTLQDIEDEFRGLSMLDRKLSEPLAPEDHVDMLRRSSSVMIVY